MDDRTLARFMGKIRRDGGCWLWTTGLFKDGYGAFWIEGRTQRAHRVSYEHYHGDLGEGLCVCHRCDVRECVNPEHLFLGTHAENMRDRDRKRRNNVARGERHGHSKLTANDVREIRRLLAAGVVQRRIAERFDVPPPTITKIKKGDAWSHVK